MTESAPATPAEWLAHLAAGSRAERVVHTERIPARVERTADWPAWVHPQVLGALLASGVERPWSHQAQAADAAWRGEHVVLATGTASGKSLGYLLPVASAALDPAALPDRPGARPRPTLGRGVTALYLAPTKALGADQLTRVAGLGLPGFRVATLDGDTPSDERRWVREHAHYVLTNPDLLHHTLLPTHERWAPFLRALSFVVVDECHLYRGVLGSHVSAVLRRLLRLAERYGSAPTVVLASATIADPGGHASNLTALPVRAITEDGSPREAMTFAFWEPPVAEDDPDSRRSALSEAADVTADLVADGVQTVCFARSRRGVEVIADAVRDSLARDGRVRDVAGRRLGRSTVAAYRGGYLPEERRAVERALRSGEVRAVAATNALELGVDISGLDAVVMTGWPGTRASLWQQAGRAGRSGRESLAVLVGAEDPLDQYVLHHPELVFGEPVEASVMDPANPYVLGPHLAAAAAELALTDHDRAWFGETMPALADTLAARGVLRRRAAGWFWTHPNRPTELIDLRGAGRQVTLVEAATGRVLGTVDEQRAHSTAHPGAVYLHQGITYVVTGLDLDDAVALLVRGNPGWSTQARAVESFEIGVAERSRRCGPATVAHGTVRVTSQVNCFFRSLPGGEIIGRHPLEMPAVSLETRGTWYTLPEQTLASWGVGEPDVPGALHAAEHAAIGLLPLLAMADRWDLGGVSTALHPDTGLPTVLVYDAYPGGAGFAERGYERMADWLAATLDAVRDCPCTSGCPLCVQSPKCGNGNEPLDKAGAAAVLAGMLELVRAP